jgi:hypothetical protein
MNRLLTALCRHPTRNAVRALAVAVACQPWLAAQSWTLGSPATSPSPRSRCGLVYGETRDRTLLFGGVSSTAFFLGDAWEFDGSTWIPVAVPPALGVRADHAFAYDHGRGKVVLYGGLNFTPASLTQTWEYDGSWTLVATANNPGMRQRPAMAWDAARRRVVLFGGSAGFTWPTDTWEYDGVDWTAVTTANAPSGRSGVAMVYDRSRGRCVLFGGEDRNSAVFADTWEYDGSDWSLVAATPVPPARSTHGLAYDVVRGRVVLFGGSTQPPFTVAGDTWEYDGTARSWSPLSPAGTPTARNEIGLVYDLEHRCVRMFGGRLGFPSGAYLGETWSFVTAATPTWTRHGLGCPGGAGVPSLDPPPGGVPALGTQLPLQLTSLPASPGMFLIGFGLDVVSNLGVPLPQDLASHGLAGCDLWVTPADINFLLPHSGSAATFVLAIPAVPVLAGTLVGTQAMVVDAGAGNGVGTVSNGGILLLR